jgi:hypothetical protein
MTEAKSMPTEVELHEFGGRPPVLLFAEDAGERVAWQLAISAVGTIPTDVADIGSLVEDLERRVRTPALMALEGAGEDRICAALAAAERVQSRHDAPLLISVPSEMIDAAMAAVGDHATILCKPDFADRVSALALALDRAPNIVVRDNPGLDGLRLKRLADEVNRIARALSNLTEDEPPRSLYNIGEAVSDVQLGFRAQQQDRSHGQIAPNDVRAMLRLRRMRDRFFPGDLFADPAWDMLLDLFAARMEGDNVAVSSLCIAAAVPPTTALRWIKTMTDADLFERHADPMDGRRIFIRLSDRATDGMQRFFAAADGAGPRMV